MAVREEIKQHIIKILDGCDDINYGGDTLDRHKFSSLQTMRVGINFIPDNQLEKAMQLFIKIIEGQVLRIQEGTNHSDRNLILSQLKCSLPWISSLEELARKY